MFYKLADTSNPHKQEIELYFMRDVLALRNDSINDTTTVYLVSGDVVRLAGIYDLKGVQK